MKFERTGVILCTERYAECVAFYGGILDLPVLETLDDEHSTLTVFAFGTGAYLMVETGGDAAPQPKTLRENPVWLRFNVRDIEAAAKTLRAKGIDVTIRREVWGTVGDFADPDGNVCSLREEAGDRAAF